MCDMIYNMGPLLSKLFNDLICEKGPLLKHLKQFYIHTVTKNSCAYIATVWIRKLVFEAFLTVSLFTNQVANI